MREGLSCSKQGCIAPGAAHNRPRFVPARPAAPTGWQRPGAPGWSARATARPPPPPTRLQATGRVGHALNLAVFLVLYLWEPTSYATLVFYGASMLLAALRGYGGCEVLAVPNWLLGRDDQIGGALFWPIDHRERH